MRITPLAVACFMILAFPIADGQTDVVTISPDGVRLDDFYETSEVWSRAYGYHLPEGVEVDDILDRCQVRGNIPMGECMKPYMYDLHWVDSQDKRVGSQPAESGYTDVCVSQVNEVKIHTHDFWIRDPVDSTGYDAEGFFKISYQNLSCHMKETGKYWCVDDEVWHGDCDRTVHLSNANRHTTTATGFTQKFWLEFVDEDPWNPDDTMDISFKLGRATVPLELVSDVATGIVWYGDKDVSNPPEPGVQLCHAINNNGVCSQEGETDTGDSGSHPNDADNDDAELQIRVEDLYN